MNQVEQTNRLPKWRLLEALLAEKGLSLQGAYTYPDLQKIFNCSKRALQDYVHDGKLNYRSPPGRAHWLSSDLEDFLDRSLRKN